MWFWLLLGFIVIIGGCVAVIGVGSKAITDANNKKHTVVYTVTGTGSADITYDSFTNGNSGSSQVSNAALPWTKTIVGSGLFNIYDVTATIGVNGGSLSCTITVDGKQVSSQHASGELGTAD